MLPYNNVSDVNSTVCLGPTGAGKTLLLKRLQNAESVDATSCTVPTTGTNLTTVRLTHSKTGMIKEVTIRELGGSMAPIWPKYYHGVSRVMYVVDASNLCQIAASGVLLYTILAEPQLQRAKILIVLTKMDVSYRQMRNEALLILQMKRLQSEVSQPITLLEASAVTGEGLANIGSWLLGNLPKDVGLKPK